MSFFDELGLRAANELERNVGPYLALQSYKRLLPAPPHLRIQAALGALRCAFALDDASEVASILLVWVGIATAAPCPDVVALVLALERARKSSDALRVAEAELQRHPSARAAYLVARLRTEQGATGLEAWETALLLAERDGDRPARARAVGALCRAPHGSHRVRERMLALADAVKDDVSETEDVLAVAEVRLSAPSKFQRASALSTLDALARAEPRPGTRGVRRAAILIAARHVDRMGPRIDPIEIDRVRSILRHVPDEAHRTSMLLRLELLEKTRQFDIEGTRLLAERCDARLGPMIERAHALAAGTGAGTREVADGAFLLLALSLDLVQALANHEGASSVQSSSRASDANQATLVLSRAIELLERGARAPSAIWAGIRLGLMHHEVEVRRLCGELARAALRERVPMPRRHTYVDLGLLLQRAGRPDIALVAFEEATEQREPEGLKLFASIRQREAYAAIAVGDRARGLSLLREAKRLLTHSSSTRSG